jgi:hypothetical protein
MASTIFAALRGAGKGDEKCADMLISQYHPDIKERRLASQRMIDDFEVGFESEAREAEFIGEQDLARQLRKQLSEARARIEKELGETLARHPIIENES